MSRDPELSDRQQRFIEAVARGLSAQAAARSVGYAPAYARKASRFLKSCVISRAIAEIRGDGRKVAAYDMAKAMQEANEVIAFARQHKNAMAYCKAVELRAKLSGLLVEKIELFTADLRGALELARKKVIQVSPEAEAALAQIVGPGNGGEIDH